GRVAIVTGGNGGIGLGMARGLARAGARVVIAARDEAKSKDAVKELEAFGAEARAVTTDVTDEAAVGRMVRATLDAFGRLDVLVNNAGTNIRKPPHAGRPLGYHRRHGGHRGLPREPRLRLRHGIRHSRRRRLLDPGLSGATRALAPEQLHEVARAKFPGRSSRRLLRSGHETAKT